MDSIIVDDILAPGKSIMNPEVRGIPKFTQRRDVEPCEWEHGRVTDFAAGPVEYYINDVRVTTDQFFRTMKEFNVILNHSVTNGNVKVTHKESNPPSGDRA